MRIIDVKKQYGEYIITLQIFSESYTCEFIRYTKGVWCIIMQHSMFVDKHVVSKLWADKLEKLYQEYKA